MQFYKFAVVLTFIFAIVFADDDPEDSVCESKFCEEDPNYPEALLNSMELWKYKFDPEEKHIEKRSIDTDFSIVEEKLCRTRQRLVRPQRLATISNRRMTIVNHKNYTQAVMIEECSNENDPCTFESYPRSLRSVCRQLYTEVDFVTLDDNHKEIVTEKFYLPSSCSCQVARRDFLKGVNEDLLEPYYD